MASASNSLLPAAPSIRVALHADLKELLAKSPAERKRFLEELYSRAIPDYVKWILSSDQHNVDTMQHLERMIASLICHCVHTDDSQDRDEAELLGTQLSKQFAPLATEYKFIKSFCSALSAGRSDLEVEWSLALPPLRAEHLQDQESLLRALFERGEWLNASRHLFVVPLLVCDESDLSRRVDPNVREFCIQLKDGEFEMGCVARELLQVHAECSAQVAAQCVQRVFEWGAVWKSFEWAVKCVAANQSEYTAAELPLIVRDINQLIHSDKWRSEQRDLLIALARCKRLWIYPIIFKDQHMSLTDTDYKQSFAAYFRVIHKCFLFGFWNEYSEWISTGKRIEEKPGTTEAANLLVRTLIDMFGYWMDLMDFLEREMANESQEVTDSQRSLVEALELTPVRTRSLPTIDLHSDANAATELLDVCTRAHRWQRDAEGDSALDPFLRESLKRIPFARWSAMALRICLQCCSVWSLLERCVGLVASSPEGADALVETVEAIGAKVQSDEWRADVKRNLLTALSVQEIWFLHEHIFSTLSRHCFLFEPESDLFDQLRRFMMHENSRVSRAVLSCIRHLLEFAVQMLEEIGCRISCEPSNAAINDSFASELRGYTHSLHRYFCPFHSFPSIFSSIPSDASTRLLEFLMNAIGFQESCRSLSARNPELDALVAVPLVRCLPLAFRTCLRCTSVLYLLLWAMRIEKRPLRKFPCLREEVGPERTCFAALSETLHSEDWRAEQKRGFSAAILHITLWLYPLTDTANRICFLFAQPDDLIINFKSIESLEIRIQFFQLYRSLLEFGVQLMQQLQSPPTPNPLQIDPLCDPRSIRLIESPAPKDFHWSASAQLVQFWINSLKSVSSARYCSTSAVSERSVLSLRLRIQAMLTGLLFEQLEDETGDSQREGTVRVFDFRYSENVIALFSLLRQNLRTLSELEADDFSQSSAEWREVELLYKRTLRLLWALLNPVQLMSETKCANEQQKQSLELFKSTFESALSTYIFVNNLAYSVQLPTPTFYNLYFTQLKNQISDKIFKDTKQIIKRIDGEIWISYLKLYNIMLNQSYHKSSLDDFSTPFLHPSLVVPCLILSLFKLPCNLTTIHRKHLHDEAVLFNLPEHGRTVAVCESAAPNDTAAAIAQISSRKILFQIKE